MNSPIRFIIEDNTKSVCTDTRETWKQEKLTYEDGKHPLVVYYKYETKYPHAGGGRARSILMRMKYFDELSRAMGCLPLISAHTLSGRQSHVLARR